MARPPIIAAPRSLVARAVVALAAVASAAGAAAQESPERILPEPRTHIEDRANVVDSGDRSRIERTLSRLREETQARCVFLTIDTTRPVDVAAFAEQNAQAWNLTRGDEGALLVVAVDDREWHLAVSTGLEDFLDASFIRRLGSSTLAPAFRRGAYGDGLADAAESISRRLRAEAASSEADGGDGPFAPSASPSRRERGPSGPSCGMGILGVVVVLFVIGAISRAGRGSRSGCSPMGGCSPVGGGCLPGMLMGSLLGGGFSSSRRRSWGGSRSWGGFGGGGGFFGGGGGGGSWGGGGGRSFGGGGGVFRGGGGGGKW